MAHHFSHHQRHCLHRLELQSLYLPLLFQFTLGMFVMKEPTQANY
jgi:hypothetical protein